MAKMLITNYQVLGNLPERCGITFPDGISGLLSITGGLVNIQMDVFDEPVVDCFFSGLGFYGAFTIKMLFPALVLGGLRAACEIEQEHMRKKKMPIPQAWLAAAELGSVAMLQKVGVKVDEGDQQKEQKEEKQDDDEEVDEDEKNENRKRMLTRTRMKALLEAEEEGNEEVKKWRSMLRGSMKLKIYRAMESARIQTKYYTWMFIFVFLRCIMPPLPDENC